MAMCAPSVRSVAISSITVALYFHRGAFRELEFDRRQGNPDIGKVLTQLDEEIGALDLPGADVERKPAIEAAAFNCQRLATSATTYSPISAMRLVRLAIGMKVAGQTKPSCGGSSEKRFAPATPPYQAHLRLEGEHELVALDGVGQRLSGFDLLLMFSGEIGVEQAMLSTALGLGVIHRDVGGAHQCLMLVPWSGEMAMPIDAPMSTLCEESSNGSEIARTMCREMRWISSTASISGKKM